MKKHIFLILSVLGLAQGANAEQYEASMAFDLENVRPFLNELNMKVALGLDVDKVVTFISKVPIDAERSKNFNVRFRGEKKQITLLVHMDDVDAPDLYFLSSSKELTNEIDREMSNFTQKLGI